MVHIYLLAGFQHRILVAMQWLWRYLTYDHGARLIVEPTGERACKTISVLGVTTALPRLGGE
jgi:hypothetical protein